MSFHRVGLRAAHAARLFRQSFRQTLGRRAQTTDAAAAAPEQSAFQRLWNSPVGIKTVHFWAPVMKWSLVVAGIGDFFRPAEKLSLTQNMALTATGAIWTRWCFVIKPKNMLLAAVNFFLACVGVIQTTRILSYQASVKGSTTEAIKDDAKDIAATGKSAIKDGEAKVVSAVKS